MSITDDQATWFNATFEQLVANVELAIRGKEQFIAAGGQDLAALDCLNTSAPGMAMLEALIRRELAGWL